MDDLFRTVVTISSFITKGLPDDCFLVRTFRSQFPALGLTKGSTVITDICGFPRMENIDSSITNVSLWNKRDRIPNEGPETEQSVVLF